MFKNVDEFFLCVTYAGIWAHLVGKLQWWYVHKGIATCLIRQVKN